jgi:hypothetical protein
MEFDEKELRREIAFAIRNIHGQHYVLFVYCKRELKQKKNNQCLLIVCAYWGL